MCCCIATVVRTDIVVGSPVAGRARPEVEDLIGMFVNTVVMRLDLDSDPGFGAFLERVRRDGAGGVRAPVGAVRAGGAGAGGRRRDLSRNPVFQVNFTYQDFPPETLRLGSLMQPRCAATWASPTSTLT